MIDHAGCHLTVISSRPFKRHDRRATPRDSLRNARGFTLADLLVTLAVLGLVMAAAAEVQIR